MTETPPAGLESSSSRCSSTIGSAFQPAQSEEVPTARNLLSAADAKGDVEATALMLLLDNQDNQDVLLAIAH